MLCGDTKKSGQIAMSEWTRPNVNYAKDWLNHSFLCPGLVWSQKEFHFGCDHQGAVNNHFPVYWGLFRHGDEQPSNQLGDPSASLLLTIKNPPKIKKTGEGTLHPILGRLYDDRELPRQRGRAF